MSITMPSATKPITCHLLPTGYGRSTSGQPSTSARGSFSRGRARPRAGQDTATLYAGRIPHIVMGRRGGCATSTTPSLADGSTLLPLSLLASTIVLPGCGRPGRGGRARPDGEHRAGPHRRGLGRPLPGAGAKPHAARRWPPAPPTRPPPRRPSARPWPGRAVGPARRLARRRRARRAAPQRQGARLRLGRRPRHRDLPGAGPHPGHGLGPRHRHADPGERDHRLQHLLQRSRPPDGRVALRRRREQGPAARRDRPDAHLRSQRPTPGASGRTCPRGAGIRASPR